MAQHRDILIIGGGIAGLSAAAELAQHANVTVLEAEGTVGYHSSGRSATMLHYALGDPQVRALTFASRGFFEDPPDDFSEVPLGARASVLVHAREDELGGLEALDAAIAPFATLERVGEEGLAELCPILRTGEGGAVAAIHDPNAIRLDSDALLQGHVRALRRRGGTLVTDARVSAIARAGAQWQVETERGDTFCAPVIVNAAGSWADAVAVMAGLGPVALTPLKRTIITFDAPAGMDSSGWPFTKTVADELYFAPESGRLFASPMDEVATDPCDAQADEFEVALAAWRMEERTSLKVERIHSRWAGIRTFAPDRHLVAGFDPRADGFFWLAGQGGFGLQTSPVMGRIVEAIVAGTRWPTDAVRPDELSPARFLG